MLLHFIKQAEQFSSWFYASRHLGHLWLLLVSKFTFAMNGFSGQWDKVNDKIFPNEVAPTSTEQGTGRAGTPLTSHFCQQFAIFCHPSASIWTGGELHHPQVSTLSEVWQQKPSHNLALPFQKYKRVLFCLGCTAAAFASPTPQRERFCSLEMNWKDLEQELSSAQQLRACHTSLPHRFQLGLRLFCKWLTWSCKRFKAF